MCIIINVTKIANPETTQKYTVKRLLYEHNYIIFKRMNSLKFDKNMI